MSTFGKAHIVPLPVPEGKGGRREAGDRLGFCNAVFKKRLHRGPTVGRLGQVRALGLCGPDVYYCPTRTAFMAFPGAPEVEGQSWDSSGNLSQPASAPVTENTPCQVCKEGTSECWETLSKASPLHPTRTKPTNLPGHSCRSPGANCWLH